MYEEITYSDFIEDVTQIEEIVALRIYSSTSSGVFPPAHVIRANPNLVEFIDLSDSRLMKYPNLEELNLESVFIDALPSDISKLTSLKSLSVMFSDKVNLNEELTKLKRITSLETLRVEFSLLNENQFNLLVDSLDGAKVYY